MKTVFAFVLSAVVGVAAVSVASAETVIIHRGGYHHHHFHPHPHFHGRRTVIIHRR